MIIFYYIRKNKNDGFDHDMAFYDTETKQIRYEIVTIDYNLPLQNVKRGKCRLCSIKTVKSYDRYCENHKRYSAQYKKIKNFIETGYVNNYQTPKVKDKIKKVMKERYGGIGLQSPKIKEKVRKTNLKLYGVENAAQTPEARIKQRKTFELKRYGIELNQIKKDFIEYARKHNVYSACQKWNIHYNTIRKFILDNDPELIDEIFPIKKHGTKSTIERQTIEEIENNLNIKFQTSKRGMFSDNPRKEIDALNSEYKISIEFDGIYWHGKHPDGSILKKENMNKLGYKHYVINELTDLPKFINVINPNKKIIYARKCTIKEISNLESRDMLNKNHLSGYASAKLIYGLYLNNNLIQVMSFGKPRFNKNYEWEIIRLCTDFDYRVVGGTERLWKRFIKDISPENVITYCDNRYFTGEIYRKLGMSFDGVTNPNYVWSDRKISLSRYQTQKHKLSKLLGSRYDPDKTEDDNMSNAGWLKVYDLGNSRWTYSSSAIRNSLTNFDRTMSAIPN